MATYEIYFKDNSHCVECDSMSEAVEEAANLVADPGMDWKVKKNGSITYYDYFVDVVVKKYDNDEDDDEDDDDDDEDEVRMALVHKTKLPDKCPFCGCNDWSDPELVHLAGLERSICFRVSTCEVCGATKEETSYERCEKMVEGTWIKRRVVFEEEEEEEEE